MSTGTREHGNTGNPLNFQNFPSRALASVITYYIRLISSGRTISWQAGRPALSRHRRGCSSAAEVKVQEGESIESALRRFKRKVQQEDIIKDIKKHSFYLKPGDKRRAKQALARKRNRKKMRRETE